MQLRKTWDLRHWTLVNGRHRKEELDPQTMSRTGCDLSKSHEMETRRPKWIGKQPRSSPQEGKRKREDICKITLEPHYRHGSKLIAVGFFYDLCMQCPQKGYTLELWKFYIFERSKQNCSPVEVCIPAGETREQPMPWCWNWKSPVPGSTDYHSRIWKTQCMGVTTKAIVTPPSGDDLVHCPPHPPPQPHPPPVFIFFALFRVRWK